jgi:ABC-type polysaccharide/polyol phosphate transport system ATPase subunit
MNSVTLMRVNLFRRTQEEFNFDFKGMMLHALSGRYRTPARRQVLRDVDLTVSRGEKIGLIGANGSGKSTLLKVITGILTPTSGSVHVSGRLAPLIELGAGFEPELSVEENIVYYGVLLGFSQAHMRERLPAILAFAELADRAHEPLKSLSSGMNARLGFAIATDSHPEILLLDEVLSVGDERFRTKSSARIQELWSEHATIIVVSHELSFISQSCDRVIWLRDGSIVEDGKPDLVIEHYRDMMHRGAQELVTATS